jgi:hypothetical protein
MTDPPDLNHKVQSSLVSILFLKIVMLLVISQLHWLISPNGKSRTAFDIMVSTFDSGVGCNPTAPPGCTPVSEA